MLLAIDAGNTNLTSASTNAAAKLSRIAVTAQDDPAGIGKSSEEGMRIGVFWGYVSVMEGLVSRMRAQIGRPVKVISTGGLAVLFDTHSDIFDAVAPGLTILGLALMYERSLRP